MAVWGLVSFRFDMSTGGAGDPTVDLLVGGRLARLSSRATAAHFNHFSYRITGQLSIFVTETPAVHAPTMKPLPKSLRSFPLSILIKK